MSQNEGLEGLPGSVPATGAATPKSAAPEAATTCFGESLDVLARQTGGWPERAVAYAVEVLNRDVDRSNPDRVQIMITGAEPLGHDSKGRFVWAKAKARREFRAVVTLAQYRAATPQEGAR